ncbi:MAG: radical SAM/SPASM domain-containing protein [Bacteroidota bacterium]
MSTTRDSINILKHLSFSRIWNLFLLYFSFIISRITKKSIVWGKPFSVSIEPTTACNLSCPECPSGLKSFTRATGKLDLQVNKDLIKNVGKQLFYINYYFQGEPFLHPQFLDLVKEAKKNKIYTATSTNAHFISPKKAEDIVKSGLDRLIISIDGTTQKTYQSYRVDGILEKVIEGSKNMVAAKKALNSKTPHLIFQFLVVKPNEHQVEEVFKLAKELNIDEVRLKSAQVYDYVNGNDLIPENEKYSRYVKKSDGTYKLKAETGNHCWRMWSSCVFTWDAKVVPCCFDKDATIQLGSAKEEDFKTIWKSKKYTNFRQQILTGRNRIDICKNCSEGSKVWI